MKIANNVPLRPYQQRQVEEVDSALARNIKRMIIQAPCGAGKTVQAGYLTRKLAMPRTIMQVHRDELVRQTEEKVRAMNPDISIGVVKAERNELDSEFTIISAQTLAQEKRLKQLVEAIGGDKVLFLDDECHHSPSKTRRRTIETIAPDILIGLTATPYRTDGRKLSDLFEEVASVTTAYELISDGWLVDANGLRVDIDVNLDGINTVGGDFNNGQLAATMDTPFLNKLVVDNWEQYADSTGRKKTVAFCVNKIHAEHLYDEFMRRGHKAALVLDSTKTTDRQKIYNEFEEGDLKVIVNVLVISEGIDLPCIDTILMCRPTKSLVLFVQCIGRGMRLFQGKEDLLVLDYVGNSNKHSLVTLPTWAGVEALGVESLDHDILRVDESIRKSGKSMSMFSIVNKIRGAKTKKVTQFDVLSGGGFKWNLVDGHWMVNTGKEYVTIVKTNDGFKPYTITQETNTDNRGRPRRTWKAEAIFARPLAMDMAIGVAETKMKMNPLTDRSATWRTRGDEPTDPQLKYAAILGIVVPAGATKSDVADLIDRAAFETAMKTLTFE